MDAGSGVDLGTIGLFALVGTPYTLKFLWAPLVDALHVPILTRWLGRRRGWLVFAQLLLIAAILVLAMTDPARSPFYVAFGALLVATASATQDIVVDAFRVESLPESEQAAGMASYVAAYRVGMLVSTAGVLFMVSGFEATGLAKSTAWMWGYVAMAGMVVIGMIAALLATEPEQSRRADEATSGESAIKRVTTAAVGAFTEFLTRRNVWAVLAFVILYKFTDSFSGAMTAPFVIDLGFSRNDYAAIVKGVGLAATLLGGFAGGFLARAWSLKHVYGSADFCRRFQICHLPGSRMSASINGPSRWRSLRRTSPAQSARLSSWRICRLCAKARCTQRRNTPS